MATKISTPVFDETVQFEQYKVEVDAWCKCTNVEVKKRALVLVLAMPERKADIFESLTVDKLNAENGVTILLDHLKENYGRDELENSLKQYEDFRNFQRGNGQSILDYCSGFEQKRKRCEGNGIKFPNEVLAFEIIRNARVSPSERKLIMTGLDLNKKETLYKDAIASLKKFFNNEYSGQRESCDFDRVDGAFATWDRYNRGSFRGRNRVSRPGGFRGINRGVRSRGSDMNPVGRDGKRLQCFNCGSYRHMKFQCPHRRSEAFLANNDNPEAGMERTSNLERKGEDDHSVYFCDEFIILYSGYNKSETNELCRETLGCAILDSACSSNVAGENWFKDYYTNYLNKVEKDRVLVRKGLRSFRFGSGPVIKSDKEVDIPVVLGGIETMMTIDIVPIDIPFLLSKQQMKRFNMTLDMGKDEIVICNRRLGLNETQSGHYYLPLGKGCDNIPVFAVNLENLDRKDLYKAMNKIHCQFGHPVHDKLVKLFCDARVWNENFRDILKDIEEKCQICKLYKRTPPKPVVALPIGNDFNDAICIDLKHWGGQRLDIAYN